MNHKIPSTPLVDLSRVRSIQGREQVWLCLTDVASLFGVPTEDDQLMADFLAVPEEYRAIRPLAGTKSTWEELPVVTFAGLAHILANSPSPGFRAVAAAMLTSHLPSVTQHPIRHSRSRSSHSAYNTVPGTSVWGVQPARNLLRELGFSVSEMTQMMNMVPGRPVNVCKMPTVSAVLNGRQLPNPDTLARMEHVLQRSKAQLLSPAALEAFQRKYAQKTPALVAGAPLEYEDGLPVFPTFSAPSAPAPVPTVGVVPVVDAGDHPDLPEPDYDEDAEDAKMYAAFTEVLGASPEEALKKITAASFEAGFSTITGSPSDPEGE